MPLTSLISKRSSVIVAHQLPYFEVPEQTPIRMADTHLLAYALVEYLENSSRQSPIPRRMVQRELTVSDGKRLSARLKNLVEQGWLVQHKSQLIGRSATYEPGHLLTNNPSLEKAWLEFASSVHGVHGLLKDLRHRPARAHGHLNVNGLLILAALSNATIPLRVKELEIYFQSLMAPKTVKSYLKKLVSKGLIIKESVQIMVNRYLTGDRNFLHNDCLLHPGDPSDDTFITVAILLNSEFEGGEFIIQNKKVEQTVGYGYYHRSNIMHEITEITKGTRYSLLAFIKGNEIINPKTLI